MPKSIGHNKVCTKKKLYGTKCLYQSLSALVLVI